MRGACACAGDAHKHACARCSRRMRRRRVYGCGAHADVIATARVDAAPLHAWVRCRRARECGADARVNAAATRVRMWMTCARGGVASTNAWMQRGSAREYDADAGALAAPEIHVMYTQRGYTCICGEHARSYAARIIVLMKHAFARRCVGCA
eukprot:1435489-Pleurochrysis_carterae.AAC.2